MKTTTLNQKISSPQRGAISLGAGPRLKKGQKSAEIENPPILKREERQRHHHQRIVYGQRWTHVRHVGPTQIN